MAGNVFIINSYMWLHSFYSKNLPGNGETVTASRYRTSGGGKGAGQAFAAAFEGAHVEVLGRVGDDQPGYTCREQLESVGIGTQFLQFDKDVPSGCGSIMQDDFGGNAIAIYPGASNFFCPADFDLAAAYIKTCKAGGFQLEVNVDTVFYAIRESHKMGVRTLLDPAPVAEIPGDLFGFISFIKPNEHEASLLTGIEVTDHESAKEAGRFLLNKGIREAAIITLGDKGCVLVTPEGSKSYPAPKIKVLDPCCAGDSFAGSFVAAIAAGKTIEQATEQAICLAALTVARQGSMYNCYHDCHELHAEISAGFYDIMRKSTTPP